MICGSRRICTGVLVLVAAILGAANVFASAQQPALAQEQVLRISLAASGPLSWDAHFQYGTQDLVVCDMIYDGLIRRKPGDITVFEPDLAVEIPAPEIVDGKQVWTFLLRRGVMTHPFEGYPDGYEFTAEDVVYSIAKVKDAKRSSFAGQYAGISAEAVDRYTVRITLDTPVSPTLFYTLFADDHGGMMLAKRAVEQLGDEAFKTHPVGTGPFYVEKYILMDRVILRANKQYFRGKPILDRVEAVYMPEVASAELALRKGELDVVTGPTEQAWVEKMSAYPNIAVDLIAPGENLMLFLDMSKAPLTSLDVRKAICCAIDPKEIVQIFGDKVFSPTYSPVPTPYVAGALTKQDLQDDGLTYLLEPQIETAKQLLRQAGYPDGFILETYCSDKMYYKKPFEWLQQRLALIGVQLKLTLCDHAAYWGYLRKDLLPLSLVAYWRSDANAYLRIAFHSASIPIVGASPMINFSHFAGADDLIDAAYQELNADRQIELWRMAEFRIAEAAACYPFGMVKLPYARRSSVDWGHVVASSVNLYPQITEQTRILAE